MERVSISPLGYSMARELSAEEIHEVGGGGTTWSVSVTRVAGSWDHTTTIDHD